MRPLRFEFEAFGSINPFELDAPELRALIESKRPREIDRWDELGGEEYARAFTAARTMGYDIVGDLHREFLQVLKTPNATGEDFARAVFPILRRKGWLPDKSEREIARRLELIYDTNLRTAQAVGRWGRIQRTKAALPYLYGFTARDDRVRHPPEGEEDHRAFEGILLPVDHPFWTQYFPPLGFRCRCSVVQKTRAQAARLGPVTSEAELAERKARLGKPWGFNPGGNPLGGVQEAANRANAGRLEGAQPLDPITEAQKALEAFRKDMEGQSAKAVRAFRSPVNRDVTAETIKVEKKTKVARRMSEEFKLAAADPRYDQAREFSGRGESDWGVAKMGAAFEDNAVSALAALKPELDDLARQIGIPPLRGFTTLRQNSGANANQGDGVMGLNPQTFNERLRRVGSNEPPPTVEGYEKARAQLAKEKEPLEAQLDELIRQFDDLRARYPDVPTIRDRPGAVELLEKRNAVLQQVEALQRRDWELMRDAARVRPISTWKPGDPVDKRPFSVSEYQADGVDKARSTLFHEFGHHVHQYLNKTERRRIIDPPLERELKKVFAEYMRNRKGLSPSTYSEANSEEWFAENFSAFVMGRKDLVDAGAVELIERIFRREFV